MKRKEFRVYKNRITKATRQVLAEGHADNLNEAAFPAYSNPSPLISFLFWERLYRVTKYLDSKEKFLSVMDFGCGSGVMLPILAERAGHVIGVDVDLEPLKKINKHIHFQDNIKFQESYQKIPPGSLELILALDVLEHVDDLEMELNNISSLLAPGGEIIISGPTENIFYKIGRFLSGPAYSGDYHVRNIYDIQRETAKFLAVKKIATLYLPAPLFIIYTATAD